MCELNVQEAHHRFAVECFNGAWDLLDQEDRTEEDAAEMIHMAHASLWHWRRSEQGDPQRFAVGAWQLSRVYAAADRPEEAVRYGEESLALCRRHELTPFYVAYGYEALARAASVAGDAAERERQLNAATAIASQIEDETDRQALLGDLATI
jgi:hypothetical protein